MSFLGSFIGFLQFFGFLRTYAVDHHVFYLHFLLLFDVDAKLPLTQNLISLLVPLESSNLSLHHFIFLNDFSSSLVLELVLNSFVFLSFKFFKLFFRFRTLIREETT